VRVVKLRETEEDRRLRHAACLLSDIGWRVHPDHRGEQTLSLITNGNFGSISHQGRAFVALSVFYRYAGLSEENEPPARSANWCRRRWSSAPACSARRSASRI
jgi:exopolyphosphatase/guanosine-5'-triphosphate,3'-diphosphate pyrophosphatase